MVISIKESTGGFLLHQPMTTPEGVTALLRKMRAGIAFGRLAAFADIADSKGSFIFPWVQCPGWLLLSVPPHHLNKVPTLWCFCIRFSVPSFPSPHPCAPQSFRMTGGQGVQVTQLQRRKLFHSFGATQRQVRGNRGHIQNHKSFRQQRMGTEKGK